MARKIGTKSCRYGLLTKKEKAWFFLLCDYQPKINGLIFLVL